MATKLREYFTITEKAPTKSLVGAFSVIVKSLHILSLGTFVRISTARCLDQGDEINIVTRAEEFSTTHTPKTPHAAADQTAVSVQHFQHVDTSICNNIFKTENLVFRTKNTLTGLVTF